MSFCDICGETLDDEEAERRIKDKQVCDDCLHDGLELLQDEVGEMLDEAAEKRNSQ